MPSLGNGSLLARSTYLLRTGVHVVAQPINLPSHYLPTIPEPAIQPYQNPKAPHCIAFFYCSPPCFSSNSLPHLDPKKSCQNTLCPPLSTLSSCQPSFLLAAFSCPQATPLPRLARRCAYDQPCPSRIASFRLVTSGVDYRATLTTDSSRWTRCRSRPLASRRVPFSRTLPRRHKPPRKAARPSVPSYARDLMGIWIWA